MSQSSPRLSLPFIQSARPASPSESECYIVASSAGGAWLAQDGAIATYLDGAWQFQIPRPGWRGYVRAQTRLWCLMAPLGRVFQCALQNADLIGLGMSADSAAPFSAKLNSAFWSELYTADGGTGSLVQTLNRETSVSDVGFVLQDDFETRAMIGLFGSDTMRLSVSADGTEFHDALSIDTGTGIADQPNLPRFKAHSNYGNYIGVGTWTKLGVNVTEYNDQACFDAATNRFTAPVSGTYLLDASLLYKTNGNASARMQGRLVLNGGTTLSGTTVESSGTHNSGTTALPLQTLNPLSTGDTVELQANFRSFDGYVAADETCFWGAKVG
jgi:hypothetical protein